MRRRDFVTRIGATIILGLGVSLLAVPLEAQKAAGIKRVGWLEVCAPGSRRPHFDFSGLTLLNWATQRGRTSSSSNDLQIANTIG
jgi:hypothetical protein